MKTSVKKPARAKKSKSKKPPFSCNKLFILEDFVDFKKSAGGTIFSVITNAFSVDDKGVRKNFDLVIGDLKSLNIKCQKPIYEIPFFREESLPDVYLKIIRSMFQDGTKHRFFAKTRDDDSTRLHEINTEQGNKIVSDTFYSTNLEKLKNNLENEEFEVIESIINQMKLS